jgi:pimeloyl-ACP methyl ester carboxylesterase
LRKKKSAVADHAIARIRRTRDFLRRRSWVLLLLHAAHYGGDEKSFMIMESTKSRSWVVAIMQLVALLLMEASSCSSISTTTKPPATATATATATEAASTVAAPQIGTGFCQMFVTSSAYSCSEYSVETDDGYLLAVQRIDAVTPPVATAKGPAFLYHGIMEGGEIWVMNPGQESLAFTLASAGYQVWIGNTRSSKYTFGHITFQRQDKEFWSWCWDDLVSKDLPTMLQFVHSSTQQPVYYVGYSQGAMTAFAAFSQGPLVNLVAKAAMLSPVSHVNHITSPVALAACWMFADQICWQLVCLSLI